MKLVDFITFYKSNSLFFSLWHCWRCWMPIVMAFIMFLFLSNNVFKTAYKSHWQWDRMKYEVKCVFFCADANGNVNEEWTERKKIKKKNVNSDVNFIHVLTRASTWVIAWTARFVFMAPLLNRDVLLFIDQPRIISHLKMLELKYAQNATSDIIQTIAHNAQHNIWQIESFFFVRSFQSFVYTLLFFHFFVCECAEVSAIINLTNGSAFFLSVRFFPKKKTKRLKRM